MILDLRAHGPATLDAAVDEALLERLRVAPALDPNDIAQARQKASRALARRARRTSTPRTT